jgi:hypothetical protein
MFLKKRGASKEATEKGLQKEIVYTKGKPKKRKLEPEAKNTKRVL